MIGLEDIQKLDDDALLELYKVVKEQIQFLEGSIIDISSEEEDEDE